MKSALVLLCISLFLISQAYLADADDSGSNSAEAKHRKNSCGDLVKRHDDSDSSDGSDSDSNGDGDSDSSGSGDVSSGENSGSGSDSNGDGDSDSSGSGDKSSGENSGEGGGTRPQPTQGQCTCTTGEIGYTVTKPTAGTKKPHKPHWPCTLTEALRNVSVILTVEERVIFLQFIEYLEEIILIDVTLTNIEKVVKCSYALKHFCAEHIEIYHKIAFQYIASWGYFIDFIYVAVDLQADITETVVVLDEKDSCTLFEALLNATVGNQEQHQAVIQLIEELKVSIFLNVQLTYAQKLARIYLAFESFFEVHVEWKSVFYKFEISGYGSFESFLDVSHGYDRALTISTVIGGSSSDCVLLLALDEAVANTSFTITVRNQLKQLRIKLAAYFDVEVDVQLRLTYISQQCWQLFLVEEFITQFLDLISLEVHGEQWGIFYDILWCSQFCHNSGTCGNLGHGLGTSPAPITTPTTTQATSTVKSVDCTARSELIVVSQQNTTVLTDVLTVNYNSWNASTRLGFNTCFNQVRNDIWNNAAFPTPAAKITDIVKNFKSYNANNFSKQQVLMSITIEV
ncbi:hypothetical protein DdX_12823 [Ditylenchus destructor]|uniref:Uncharacterized protein n=1 Tax=Ditylenchus destructor TaxID=166010 RepID=A0AAD4MU17_9BILA|nr:hypothetical protein DdX_12823 [Ditylenchus destructor]